MKFKTIAVVLALASALALPAAVGAIDPRAEDLVGKDVYLKHNLVFAGPAPKVYADDIVFIEDQQDCQAAVWAKVLPKSVKVKILAVSDEGDFVRLSFAPGIRGNLDVLLEKVDVLLAKAADGDFRPAFANAFSLTEVQETYVEQCEPATEAELIAMLGYPIYKCRKNDLTIYYYNLGFIGCRINGFHDIWFEIRDGEVIKNHGYI